MKNWHPEDKIKSLGGTCFFGDVPFAISQVDKMKVGSQIHKSDFSD
jgi:hypothetical protein